MDSKTNTNQTIHLQGIGRVPAIPASELAIGDTTVWNYGGRETICGIIAKGKTQLVLHVAMKGGFYTRTVSRARLVAVAR